MKTILTSIITSVITVVIALLVVYAIMGDNECMFRDDDHEEECTEYVKKEYHPEKDTHHMMMKNLVPAREKLETMLSDEEKATIESIREKFKDVDYNKMCEEGKKKFHEQNKKDFDALLAIAETHKDFMEEVHAKMCMTAEVDEGDVKKEGCPEVHKCKQATEKCKGTPKDAETDKKCKEAEEKCKTQCMNTFKVNLLLMKECKADSDDEGERGRG